MVWDATGRYVDSYVDQTYPTDQDVQGDHELHDWMEAAGPLRDDAMAHPVV